MNVKWMTNEVDPRDFELQCPVCGASVVPSPQMYCSHVVFVYLEPSIDDPGFDFVVQTFASKYLDALVRAIQMGEIEDSLSLESQVEFLQAELPSFNRLGVKLYRKIVSDSMFVSSNPTVYETQVLNLRDPTRVIVAFETAENE